MLGCVYFCIWTLVNCIIFLVLKIFSNAKPRHKQNNICKGFIICSREKGKVQFALGNGTTSYVMINFDVLPENRSIHVYVERMKICVLKIVENVPFLPDFVGLKSIFCWWRKDKLLELFLCWWIILAKSVSLLLSLFAIFSLTFHTLSCFTRTSCVRNDVAQELNKKENHFTNSRMCSSSICSAHLRFERTNYGPNQNLLNGALKNL